MVHVVFLVSLVAAAGLVLLDDAGASTLVQQDSFTGADGTSPDTGMWTVYSSGSNDYVRIEANTVRTHVVDTGRTWIWTKDGVDAPNLTMLVDWLPRVFQGNCGNVVLYKDVSGNPVYFLRLSYGATGDGWALRYIRSGYERSSISFQRTASADTWYTWNITIRVDTVNIRITERASGALVHSWTDVLIDDLNGDVTCQIGSFATESLRDPSANWDNFRLYDLTPRPNDPPQWISVPHPLATEDVPLIYDFSGNVTDIDDPVRDLTVRGISPYITDIDGLNVTFLFPNNVTTAQIPMVLSDGYHQVVADINFTVTPVNDPPEQAIPTPFEATEAIPLVLDVEPYVWDIDNEREDLFLMVDDEYAHVDGLVLTVQFPAGVEGHRLLLHISDGLLVTSVWLDFTVVPVDDPPTIDDLGELGVVEDQERTLDLAPFLHDVDTPLEDLVLSTGNPNCTIEGHLLVMLYTTGGVVDAVIIVVSDGRSSVTGELRVTVAEVNDPPFANDPPPRAFTEGRAHTMDLAPYIGDEDTPKSQLVLTCDHPAVIAIDGLTMTLRYEEWWSQHSVEFTVSDGEYVAAASFIVQVIAVNDAPVIDGIGDLDPPYVITIEEGTTRWYDIDVLDEEGGPFRYDLESEWGGIAVHDNGTMVLRAGKGEVGEYSANLLVVDEDRGSDDVDILVVVVDVNDPPTIPVILRPENGGSFEKNSNITFDVDIDDPDMILGQVLTVIWTSNLTGPVMELTSDDDMAFAVDSLTVGEHLITVTVSDGEFARSASVVVRVTEPDIPSPNGGDGGDEGPFPSSISVLVLAVIVIIAIAVAVLMVRLTRHSEQ